MREPTKVAGLADFSVTVECPECNHSFDATDNDDEHAVSGAMFENTTPSCTDMQIDLMCPKCECEFILDSLDY